MSCNYLKEYANEVMDFVEERNNPNMELPQTLAMNKPLLRNEHLDYQERQKYDSNTVTASPAPLPEDSADYAYNQYDENTIVESNIICYGYDYPGIMEQNFSDCIEFFAERGVIWTADMPKNFDNNLLLAEKLKSFVEQGYDIMLQYLNVYIGAMLQFDCAYCRWNYWKDELKLYVNGGFMCFRMDNIDNRLLSIVEDVQARQHFDNPAEDDMRDLMLLDEIHFNDNLWLDNYEAMADLHASHS